MLATDAPTEENALDVAKSALSDSVLLELCNLDTPDLSVRRRSLQGRVVRQVEFYLSQVCHVPVQRMGLSSVSLLNWVIFFLSSCLVDLDGFV